MTVFRVEVARAIVFPLTVRAESREHAMELINEMICNGNLEQIQTTVIPKNGKLSLGSTYKIGRDEDFDTVDVEVC